MRNVYLFELDSVKTSDREIAAAQKAMFDEIVCNGNCVVLSMNQMTDSRAVMSMLDDEEQYHILMELFQRGYIKYSLYKSLYSLVLIYLSSQLFILSSSIGAFLLTPHE